VTDKRITLNNVMVTITGAVLSMSIILVSWVYTTDRKEFKDAVKSIDINVQSISKAQEINRTISNAFKENTDARLSLIETDQRNFYRDSRNYWRRGNGSIQ